MLTRLLRNSFCILTTVAVLFATSSSASAQSSSSNQDVIISIPHLNPQQFSSTKNLLSSINGISYMGYCQNLDVFLLRVDRSIQATNEVLLDQLKAAHLDFNFKIGGTVDQVMAQCKDPHSENDMLIKQQ